MRIDFFSTSPFADTFIARVRNKQGLFFVQVILCTDTNETEPTIVVNNYAMALDYLGSTFAKQAIANAPIEYNPVPAMVAAVMTKIHGGV